MVLKRKHKPGLYYIGDPCYIKTQDEWVDFLENRLWGTDEFFYSGTRYGDGSYPLESKWTTFALCVDSGMLACIPFSEVTNFDHTIGRCGILVNFDKEFECTVEEGVFHFGDLLCDTKF